jgi:predicted Zn-dependent protease
MTGNDILSNAIQLIQAGEKAMAQKLLEPYLRANPHDVTAWLWEARTYPSLETRINVLERCLSYNPNHQQILTVLAALNTQRGHKLPNQ